MWCGLNYGRTPHLSHGPFDVLAQHCHRFWSAACRVGRNESRLVDCDMEDVMGYALENKPKFHSELGACVDCDGDILGGEAIRPWPTNDP